VEAVVAGGDANWAEGEGDERKKESGVCSYAVGDQGVEVGVSNRTVEVAVAAGVTVVLGVGNRVLYKLALVPLKHYPFFLAQLATFGYVIVYFSILYYRYHGGLVTDEMLSLPKTPFLAVGFLEALAAASGMAAGALLSGAAITILSQSFLVWQLLLSYIILGRRYRFNQLFGCFLVAAGVVITVSRLYTYISYMQIHTYTYTHTHKHIFLADKFLSGNCIFLGTFYCAVDQVLVHYWMPVFFGLS
jgi:uncharacterized membrane protein